MITPILLSFYLKVFQECDEGLKRHRILEYVLVFSGLGALMLITMFLQVSLEEKFFPTFPISLI